MAIHRLALLLLALAAASPTLAKQIDIDYVSGLDFGTSASGDPAVTVPAGSSETASNASFLVDGDKNRSYTIVLPTSATMITGSGVGASRRITLNAFTSFPAESSGLLNNVGEQMVYVGATRAALSTTQQSGAYTGTFTITVVY